MTVVQYTCTVVGRTVHWASRMHIGPTKAHKRERVCLCVCVCVRKREAHAETCAMTEKLTHSFLLTHFQLRARSIFIYSSTVVGPTSIAQIDGNDRAYETRVAPVLRKRVRVLSPFCRIVRARSQSPTL